MSISTNKSDLKRRFGYRQTERPVFGGAGSELRNPLAPMLGNNVSSAYDGEQALEMAKELKPDVVLLDIGLPKLNGYDVAKQIRLEPWGSSPILIAITGWGQAEDKALSREAGFDHHLVKPVDPDALLTFIQNARPLTPNQHKIGMLVPKAPLTKARNPCAETVSSR